MKKKYDWVLKAFGIKKPYKNPHTCDKDCKNCSNIKC